MVVGLASVFAVGARVVNDTQPPVTYAAPRAPGRDEGEGAARPGRVEGGADARNALVTHVAERRARKDDGQRVPVSA